MSGRGIPFQRVPSLSQFRLPALLRRCSLSRCPSLSQACPDNLRTDLVPLSPPLQGDKVDRVGSVLLKSHNLVRSRKGISSTCRSIQFARRPLLSRERSPQIYGYGIPCLPRVVPFPSFDRRLEGMRNSRSDSATIKSCAVHHSVSERAVRQWRLNDDPRWRAWLARSARTAEQLEVFSGVAEVKSDPSTEAEAARVRFGLLTRLVDQATARGEVAGLPVLLKSAQECQRLLASCREAEAAWMERQREMIPRAEFRKWIQSHLAALLDVVTMMSRDVCEDANPNAPDIAFQAIDAWRKTRFETHFKAAVAAFDRMCEIPSETQEVKNED